MMPVALTSGTNNQIIDAVGNGLTSVIGWIGEVITAITSGELSALLPLFAIGISISAILFGIRAIKSIVWGA